MENNKTDAYKLGYAEQALKSIALHASQLRPIMTRPEDSHTVNLIEHAALLALEVIK